MVDRNMIGIGIVGGARGISQAHLAAYRFLGETVAAICDVDATQGRAVAEAHDARFTDDLDELLSMPEVTVVDLCSPDHLHADQAVAAARAGRHVLCEKPMALSVADCKRMAAACKQAGVTFMVGMSRRWSPEHLQMKRAVEGGHIGRVVLGRYRVTGAFYPYPEGSVNRRAESLGQLVHNGPHYLDELCHLMDALPRSVYAATTQHFTDAMQLETPNYHLVSMTTDDGRLMEIELNQLLVDPPSRTPTSEVLLVGTEGTLSWSTAQCPGLTIRRGDGTEPMVVPAALRRGEGFVGELEHFLDCVRRGTPPSVPAAWSVRQTAAVLAAVESARTGRVIDLDEWMDR